MEMLVLLNTETVKVAWGPQRVESPTAIGSKYTTVKIFKYADIQFSHKMRQLISTQRSESVL